MHVRNHSGRATAELCQRTRSGLWWRTFLVFIALGAAAAPVLGQADRVDAGSFSILQNGKRIGREQFSLRRAPSPDGTAFELRAESIIGERRAAVQLSTDSLGSPVHYSLEIREGTTVTVRAGGQRARARFITQVRRAVGESAREYLLIPGIIVLEPEFYHQLAFVLRGRMPEVDRTVAMTALSLLENSQQRLTLVLESQDDAVTIAGVPRPALRWRLDGVTGTVLTVWGDAAGRVLRVIVPSRSLELVRDDLPK